MFIIISYIVEISTEQNQKVMLLCHALPSVYLSSEITSAKALSRILERVPGFICKWIRECKSNRMFSQK
jgi:hypothetical protein